MLRAMGAIGGKNPCSSRKGGIFCGDRSAKPVDKHLVTIKHLENMGKFILPKDRRI